MTNADFVVVGAGIVGLTLALEIKRRAPGTSVVVLEKETSPGCHSSGRNSGVLHSGIYYPPGSLKAKLCGEGAREWGAYCRSRGLALNPIGKVLVPVRVEDGPQLELLARRAVENGVDAKPLGRGDLRALEPEAGSATGEGLFIPSTSVIDPRAVMASVVKDVNAAGISLRCGGSLDAVDVDRRRLTWAGETIVYGHAVNAAGLHADSVAHRFGVGTRFTMLPFKGIYWKLDPASGISVRHLIYPVPDLRVPFLGVHTTTAIDGTVTLGPTAIPALGRENYRGIEGVDAVDLIRIGGHLAKLYVAGRQGFRRLAWQEGRRALRGPFAEAARGVLPRLRPEHLLPSDKVGLRAQMLDRQSGELVTDFLVEGGQGSTHVLNAISPAFTSALPFARHVCDTKIFN